MIRVLAGVNGAGKSSIAGSTVRALGGDYYNPDEVMRELMAQLPHLTAEEANGMAWEQGYRRLLGAIEGDENFTFETTLGGASIVETLIRAGRSGRAIEVWYCGLSSAELHLERVKARVAAGGHNIPEAKIRQRYEDSRANLVKLIPYVTTLHVFDNSLGIGADGKPQIKLILAVDRQVLKMDIQQVPDWAKAIAMAAVHRWGTPAE